MNYSAQSRSNSSDSDETFNQLDNKMQTAVNTDDPYLQQELLSAKHSRSGSLAMDRNVVNQDSEAVTNIEDALALTGGFGTFQTLISFICMGNYVRSAFFYYPLPYFELFPEYTCVKAGTDGTPYSCKPEDFCEKSDVVATIDWEAETSLNNWVQQLELTCKSSQAIGFIGSVYFIGIMISVLTLPRASDLYGRKWVILGCQLIQFPIYFWTFWMSTLMECYMCFFIMGLGFGGSISTNSLYLQEFLQKRHRAIVMTIGQMVEGLTVAVLVLYFMYITKDWQYWQMIGAALQFCIIVGMIWAPESPEFYFAKGRFEESKQVLLRIASVNGRSIGEEAICFDRVGEEHAHSDSDEDTILEDGSVATPRVSDISAPFASNEKKPKAPVAKHCQGTLKELWQDKDLVINLFLMSCLWSITSFSFYLGKFQLKQVAGDIFINSITSSIADTVSRPVGYWFYKKLGARVAMTGLFGVAGLGSFPVIWSEMASDNYRKYFVPVCLFLMNSGVTASFGNLYIGHMDLFPVVFSTTSMGICNIAARFLTIFAPMVAEIQEPVPEIMFTILCIIAITVSLFIRKKTANYY